MAGTTISHSTTVGYSLSLSSQNPVDVTATGSVITGSADAIYVHGLAGSVVNHGVLKATGSSATGIYLRNGGTITNYSLISGGAYGAVIHYGTVTNLSAIASRSGAGVRIVGGVVANGDSNHSAATISGYTAGISGGLETVSNYGRIIASGTAGIGVSATLGGTVTNGASAVTGRMIVGGADGIYMSFSDPGNFGLVHNYGTIIGSRASGVFIHRNCEITNGDGSSASWLIRGGSDGMDLFGNGLVVNDGTVTGISGRGLYDRYAGTIFNGAAALTGRVISGYLTGAQVNGAAFIANYGAIGASGTASTGIALYYGGTIINGSTEVTSASISGGKYGIFVGFASFTLRNFGTVTATTAAGAYLKSGGTVNNYGTIASTGTAGDGLILGTSGVVVNGATDDTAASIAGAIDGVHLQNGFPVVSNFGTIVGSTRYGVYVRGYGTVTNGSGPLSHAFIGGGLYGILLGSGGTVINDGVVNGGLDAGVALGNGVVVNGDATALGGLIGGGTYGIRFKGSGSVTNFGSIIGFGPTSSGIVLHRGGTVTSGLAGVTGARIAGGSYGVYSGNYGNAVISNFGTITGGVDAIRIKEGGAVANGAGALISGATGVTIGGTGTVTNAGTIIGAGGTAIQFGSGNDRLILQPGATFVGAVNGGSGANTLEFGVGNGSTGRFTGLGSSQFSGFGTVILDSGAHWLFSGINKLTSGVTFTIASGGTLSLNNGARLLSTGGSTFDVEGRVVATAGTSTLETGVAGGGAIVLATGATLRINGRVNAKHLDFGVNGSETLQLTAPAAMKATIAGFGLTDVIDLQNVVATGATFAAGTLTVSGAAGTIAALKFAGIYSSANFKLVSDHNGGTDIVFVTPPLTHAELLAGFHLSAAAARAVMPCDLPAGGAAHDAAVGVAPGVIAWHHLAAWG